MRCLENRVPPPLLMLIIGLAMAPAITPQLPYAAPWQWLLCALLVLAGVVVVSLALRALVQHKTTVTPLQPARATSLVSSGIFARSRNPMYLAMVCFLTAWALLGGWQWQWLGPALFTAHIQCFQIAPEERAMLQLFGRDYQEYTAAVPRWWRWRTK